jgi:hypothetical protein
VARGDGGSRRGGGGGKAGSDLSWSCDCNDDVADDDAAGSSLLIFGFTMATLRFRLDNDSNELEGDGGGRDCKTFD